MKFTRVLFSLLPVFFLSSVAFAGPHYGDIKAIYIKNYDGDTITFNIPGYPAIVGKKINIRLNGVDTPEKRGKCKQEKRLARTAQQLVENQLKKAKIITLKNMSRGKYFRIVADIEFDGKDLGQVLLKNQLAVPFGKKKNKNWCE